MQNKYNILQVMFHIVRGNDVIYEYDVAHFPLGHTFFYLFYGPADIFFFKMK